MIGIKCRAIFGKLGPRNRALFEIRCGVIYGSLCSVKFRDPCETIFGKHHLTISTSLHDVQLCMMYIAYCTRIPISLYLELVTMTTVNYVS